MVHLGWCSVDRSEMVTACGEWPFGIVLVRSLQFGLGLFLLEHRFGNKASLDLSCCSLGPVSAQSVHVPSAMLLHTYMISVKKICRLLDFVPHMRA